MEASLKPPIENPCYYTANQTYKKGHSYHA